MSIASHCMTHFLSFPSPDCFCMGWCTSVFCPCQHLCWFVSRFSSHGCHWISWAAWWIGWQFLCVMAMAAAAATTTTTTTTTGMALWWKSVQIVSNKSWGHKNGWNQESHPSLQNHPHAAHDHCFHLSTKTFPMGGLQLLWGKPHLGENPTNQECSIIEVTVRQHSDAPVLLLARLDSLESTWQLEFELLCEPFRTILEIEVLPTRIWKVMMATTHQTPTLLMHCKTFAFGIRLGSHQPVNNFGISSALCFVPLPQNCLSTHFHVWTFNCPTSWSWKCPMTQMSKHNTPSIIIWCSTKTVKRFGAHQCSMC